MSDPLRTTAREIPGVHREAYGGINDRNRRADPGVRLGLDCSTERLPLTAV